ncbi:uncharacterized protein LOC121597964 [Anopheles merus]|uniref:uncharacterized protein LOC121597964 n=1 Tax=Anopheles merus TaxID=30066 RepID=UPI001BE3CFB8|nr:uncharacterized protein LOC121597964 [Anopheles merus]
MEQHCTLERGGQAIWVCLCNCVAVCGHASRMHRFVTILCPDGTAGRKTLSGPGDDQSRTTDFLHGSATTKHHYWQALADECRTAERPSREGYERTGMCARPKNANTRAAPPFHSARSFINIEGENSKGRDRVYTARFERLSAQTDT